MDLSKFPMDVQKCSLVYESFSYNRAEVKMQWGDREDPVYPLKNFTLPDFVLIHMTNSSGTVVRHRRRAFEPVKALDEQ